MQAGSPFPSKRLKRVASLRRLHAGGSEENRPYVGLEDMTPWTGKLTRDVAANLRVDAASLGNTFEPGDVLFGKLRPYLAKVWVAEFSGRCSTECFVMEPVEVEPRFLGYVCVARNFIDAVDASTYGSKMPRAEWELVGNMPIPVPERHQQRAIADYLDRETERLDALVATKQRVRELLAEKRQALITRAVTRGIHPEASYRDSGVPWLGEIPAHWTVRMIARMFHEFDERGRPHLPLLEVSIDRGVAIREFSGERIESTAADFNTYKVARRGDIVFNKMRMWQGAVGATPEDGLVSPDYLVARPAGCLSSAYASLLFRTPAFSAESARRSQGIVWDRLRLYWQGFREITVPVPPAEEQSDIVEHVRSETRTLDELSTATSQTIALLQERRSAVIAATVTGRADVKRAA